MFDELQAEQSRSVLYFHDSKLSEQDVDDQLKVLYYDNDINKGCLPHFIVSVDDSDINNGTIPDEVF